MKYEEYTKKYRLDFFNDNFAKNYADLKLTNNDKYNKFLKSSEKLAMIKKVKLSFLFVFYRCHLNKNIDISPNLILKRESDNFLFFSECNSIAISRKLKMNDLQFGNTDRALLAVRNKFKDNDNIISLICGHVIVYKHGLTEI